MKQEATENKSVFQTLAEQAEVNPYADAVTITHIKLEDADWYEIVPGSFHFYKPVEGAVPFVQFDTRFPNPAWSPTDGGTVEYIEKRVEAFPARIVAFAYDPPEDDEPVEDSVPDYAKPVRI